MQEKKSMQLMGECLLLPSARPLGGFQMGCRESRQSTWLDKTTGRCLFLWSFPNCHLTARVWFSGAHLYSQGLVCRLHQAHLQNHACPICAGNTVFSGITDQRKPESECISSPQTLLGWQSAFPLHTAASAEPPVRCPLLRPPQSRLPLEEWC